MKKVVVISAHPDDEVIGAGGTLLKHRSQGDQLYWLIVTSMTEQQGFSPERIRSRAQEISTVAERLGVEKVFTLGYPTMTLTDSDLVSMVPKISDIFTEVKPEILYCLNRSDAHSDHRIVFDAVMACTKSFRYPSIKRVLMYECISETEFAPALPERSFLPNYYVDVSSFMEEKVSILKIYDSEFGQHPFPRSVENVFALAHFRGATAGVRYAEAFQLLKFIDK